MDRKWENIKKQAGCDWEILNSRIDRFIERNQNEIVENICRLVRLPSVEEKSCGGFPYGAKCAQALDFCAHLAEEKGLVVDNYDYYGLEIRPWEQQSGKRLLFAAHADVVPASEGNIYPPFDGVVDKGYIIGRGVVDDKAPLIALLYALAFLKEEGIVLKNDVRLFAGSHEETDMEDLKYYLQRAGQPDFGIASDDDFPITNGEKSVLQFRLQRPGEVAESGTTDAEEVGMAEKVFKAFEKDWTGECFGLAVEDPVYGNSRCKITRETEHSFFCDLRLPVSVELKEAKLKIREFARGNLLEAEFVKQDRGYYISEKEGIPKLLTELYKNETGSEDEPYIMAGCTYARHFQAGCGFGAGQQGEVKPFPEGHGSAHGPDEAQNIEVILRALKLDILAALAIDLYWQA